MKFCRKLGNLGSLQIGELGFDQQRLPAIRLELLQSFGAAVSNVDRVLLAIQFLN
jgi:hypothetical protein